MTPGQSPDSQKLQPGDRVFWFSGKEAGVYASGLLWSEPYEADEPITGSRPKSTWG